MNASARPLRAVDGGEPVPSGAYNSVTAWERMGLVLNDKRLPLNTLLNAARVLECHPDTAGRFWLDVFLQRVISTWPEGEPREWTDADDIALTIFLQGQVGISRMASSTVKDAVTAVACRDRRNELTDWLNALQWDRVERLLALMERGFGAVPGVDDRGYLAAVGRCFLVGMVARALRPGCKQDTMPVLEGSQGKKKSTALQELVGSRWFAEASAHPNNKDFFQSMAGKWLIEIAELDAFSRGEVTAVKRVMTCQVDRYRASYGRRAEDHPRQCVFAGTTNRDDWNRDETGARRFWPVKCERELDLDWIRDNREQLFAEAVARYRRGEKWWDVPLDRALEEQDARLMRDVWAEPLEQFLVGRSHVTMAQVLEHGLGIEAGRQGRTEQLRAASVMRLLGWERGTVRDGKDTFKGWRPACDRSQALL